MNNSKIPYQNKKMENKILALLSKLNEDWKRNCFLNGLKWSVN